MSLPEPATSTKTGKETDVGSVFVSNYPPFSFWGRDELPIVSEVLNSQPRPMTDLGLYIHVPFCRKRCKFCYFRVYTDKNSDQIGSYLEALATEVEKLAVLTALCSRPLRFVYFGGGTPSFISAEQLEQLVDRLTSAMPWTNAEEVTFECEPGTLTRSKLEAIRRIGVTRLSLGIESFDDEILRENGRAHTSVEVFRCLPWIQELDFPQLNVDLIAGMVGETWSSWRDTVAKTVDLAPESVTVYQLELPFNTRYSKSIMGGAFDKPLADWDSKRAWHDYAFQQLAGVGYEISSAYTMVRDRKSCRFVYRDSVWKGCDLLGTGVSSFSHVSGVHFQNVDSWDRYLTLLQQGQLPLDRAHRTNERERLTRELVLQLKTGAVERSYFRDKFGVDICEEFNDSLTRLESRGMLAQTSQSVRLTRRGLLRVDSLLPEFYDAAHRDARYT